MICRDKDCIYQERLSDLRGWEGPRCNYISITGKSKVAQIETVFGFKSITAVEEKIIGRMLCPFYEEQNEE